LGNVCAIKTLSKILEIDDDESVRSIAAKTLGILGDKRAIEFLIKGLVDRSGDVRLAASQALYRLGEHNWIMMIKGRNDDFSNLGKSKDLRIFIPLVKVVQNVTKTFDYDNDIEKQRIFAANGLAKLDEKRAIEPLIETMAIETLAGRYSQISTEVAEVLNLLGETKWKDIIGCDSDSNDLLHCNDIRVINYLIKVLGDKEQDNNLRSKAAQALGNTGNQKSIEPLIEALKDSNEWVRVDAVDALGTFESQDVIKPLIETLKDSSEEVRKHAVDALGAFESQEVIETLKKALEDRSPRVRISAADVLGKLGYQDGIVVLIKDLKDDDENIRISTAGILGKLGNPRAIDPLIGAIADESNDVRKAIINALESNKRNRSEPGRYESAQRT